MPQLYLGFPPRPPLQSDKQIQKTHEIQNTAVRISYRYSMMLRIFDGPIDNQPSRQCPTGRDIPWLDESGLQGARGCWAMLKDGDMLTQYDLLLGGDWNHGIFQVNLWLIYG